MSVNIYKKETGALQKVAGYSKIDTWTGTQAEFDALDKSTLSDNCYINITDDMTGGEVASIEPIGMIISFMGKNAPAGYLICDGSEYNIADYEKLAKHFENEFGTVNNFGGDGTTTFAVPDLRGEFLRGTGTNGHANQGNGAAVGVHQNATEHLRVNSNNNGSLQIYQNPIADWNMAANSDSVAKQGTAMSSVNGSRDTISTQAISYTARPTNTSVLYCIKYM